MKIEKFEDIQSWQEARSLTKDVYALSMQQWFRRDRGLCDQIRRAAVSIMANIAEGFERQSKKEFIQFLSYASASGAELASHLYVAKDQGYVTEEVFNGLYLRVQRTRSLINGFIAYLKRRSS
jgi:four helix bundle protein